MNKKNILWVDDDVNRMTLLPDRDALEAKEFNIIAINRVDIFLQFIKEADHQISCIILDMNMPTGCLNQNETQYGTRTGIPLYKAIRENPNYNNTIIVVYSVFNKEDMGSFGEKEDVVFLSKDLKSGEFAERIYELVNNK